MAKSRSAFLRPGLASIGGLTATAAAARFVLVVLEEIPRRFRDPSLRKQLGIKGVSGFWSRSVFGWLIPVLLHGYSNVLRVEDLPSLGPKLSSEHLCAKFEKVWVKSDKNYKFCLMKATLFTLFRQFLLIFIPVLCNTALLVAQPFFIRRVMVYVRAGDAAGDTKGGLVGATVIIYSGIMVSLLAKLKIVYSANYGSQITNLWSFHLRDRFVSMARGFLVSQVFKKNLLLDQSKANESAAVTLMSTDIDGIARSFPYLYDILSSFIQLVIGIYFLARMVGAATALVAVPVVGKSFCIDIQSPGTLTRCTVSFILTFEVSRRTGSATRFWNKSVENRVATTSSILLKRLKGLKMTGLGRIIGSYIQSLREVEIGFSKKARKLAIVTYATGKICFQPKAHESTLTLPRPNRVLFHANSRHCWRLLLDLVGQGAKGSRDHYHLGFYPNGGSST